MKVKLRNPDRELQVPGRRRVRDVLAELDIDPDTVLVIRNRELITREERLAETDEIEVRAVISGGRSESVSGPVTRGFSRALGAAGLRSGGWEGTGPRSNPAAAPRPKGPIS